MYSLPEKIMAIILIALCGTAPAEDAPKPDFSKVPGVVVDHSNVSTRLYMPTSSIIITPNGDYVVAHDHGSFDHGKAPGIVKLFGSRDKGRTWQHLSTTRGRHDSLFYHRGALYLIGPIHQYGNAVIRRSDDQGRTWTEPKDRKTGLLRDDAPYHSAAVPVVVHKGRIWRAFEVARGDRKNWTVVVFSVPEDANLLDADNWTVSEPIHHKGTFRQWIEGNIVVTPEGKLVNILRANGSQANKAAVVHVSDDGKTLSHNPDRDIIDFPGGGLKFTIRYDSKSSRYWSLANWQDRPDGGRNLLQLTSSTDLRNWKVERTVLRHPDESKGSFHYADFVIEGDDIIFTSRTACDDGLGGPRNKHDNNFITFHRIENFRSAAEKRNE
jgi:hypothetical protein